MPPTVVQQTTPQRKQKQQILMSEANTSPVQALAQKQRQLRPSGFEMESAPPAQKPPNVAKPASREDKGQDAQRDKMGQETWRPDDGKPAARKQRASLGGQGSSGADARLVFALQQAEAAKRRQEELAEHEAKLQREAERAAALEGANAGPLDKIIMLQTRSVWGQVACGAISGCSCAEARVDRKAAAAIATALAGLGEAKGVEALAAGERLAAQIQVAGVKCFVECGVVAGIRALLDVRETAEPALYAIKGCCELLGGKVEPFMVPFLGHVLRLVADKKSLGVRTAASETGPAIIDIVVPHATRNVQDILFAGIAEDNWHTKLLSLRLLGQFAERSELAFSRTLFQVVPVVSGAMWDTRTEVRQGATEATLKALNTCQNRDIRPFIPAVIEAIKTPEEVPETLHKLSSTVFVQSVDKPALSITVPILLRGCQEKKIESKRRVCVIADNMCKLVDYAHEATAFMPELRPAIERLAEEMSDPEARAVAAGCVKTLNRIEQVAAEFEAAKTMEPEEVVGMLADAVKATTPSLSPDEPALCVVLEYIAKTISGMIAGLFFEEKDWTLQAVCPYLAPFVTQRDARAICKIVYTQCYKQCVPRETQEDEHEEGEDLCNCEFSLGYGAKILLNNTRLHLKRGRRYGVCGHNGCGKSTLMKAIANGQVENFPPADELKTVYVEHDIQGDLSDLSLIDYVMALCPGFSREHVYAEMIAFGFVEDDAAPACIHSCVAGAPRTRAHIHVFLHACVCACMHACMHTHTCIHLLHTCTHTCILRWRACLRTHTHAHTHRPVRRVENEAGAVPSDPAER